MRPNPAPAPRDPPSSSGTRLRGVPAGYDLDGWPFATPLHPEESIAGWWRRVAVRYQMSPAGLLRELGVRVGSLTPARVEQRLARHNPHLTSRTGVTDEARAAAFARQTTILNRVSSLRHRYEYAPTLPMGAGSRYCPHCLAEEGIWRTVWRDPFTVVCPTHQVILAQLCPGCGRSPFATGSWATRDTALTMCTEVIDQPQRVPRTHRTPCTVDLRDTAVTPADADLIAAHTLLRGGTTAAPDARVTIAGLPATAAEAADALMLLTVSAATTAPVITGQDHTERVTAALRHAGQVLTAPSLARAGQVADTYGLLGPQGPLAPIAPAHALRDHPIHPVLHAIGLHAVGDYLPAATQLAFRVGAGWPRTPTGLRHQHTPTPRFATDWDVAPVPFNSLPQLWWPIGLPGVPALGGERARFAVSVAVACVGRNMTTASIAHHLGAPTYAASRVATEWARLAAGVGWPVVREAVITAATWLASHPPPIDYAQRRNQLATPDALDALLGPLGPDVVITDAEQLWCWVATTGGSPHLTPTAWGRIRSPQTTPRPPRPQIMQHVEVLLASDYEKLPAWKPP